jgi:hypothetical protein
MKKILIIGHDDFGKAITHIHQEKEKYTNFELTQNSALHKTDVSGS